MLGGGFWTKLLFSPTDVGIYKGTLYHLCQLADEAVTEMDGYHFVEKNCQHFCNRVLRKLGFKMYPATVGPELGGEDQGFDVLTLVTRNIYDATVGDEATGAGAAVMTRAVGAPSPLKGDLQVIYSILLPLADKWEEIGDKVLIDHDTLSKIKDKYRKPRRCLTEMLRVWLQTSSPPSWKTLGDAVEVYDLSLIHI